MNMIKVSANSRTSAVAGAIAGATLEVLPGAGHVPSVTQPAALVDVIERWWAGVAPQA